MAHGITLRLNEFGWDSLESEARRDGETLDDLLLRAAAYLDAELPTRRAAVLARGTKASRAGNATRASVPARWQSPRHEAGPRLPDATGPTRGHPSSRGQVRIEDALIREPGRRTSKAKPDEDQATRLAGVTIRSRRKPGAAVMVPGGS